MAKARDGSAFTPQQIAEYDAFRQRRPQMLRDIATTLRCWTTCERNACRRGKACLGEDPSACTRRVVQEDTSEADRAIFQIALGLRAGGLDGKAAWAEASRRVAQQIAAIEGLGEGG